MIPCRKGVISMPIKLTVSFMIIALMVPPMFSMVEGIRDDIVREELSEVVRDLSDQIDKAGRKGSGYSMHMDLSIPGDSYLVLGLDDGLSVRMYIGGEQVGRMLLNTPVVCGETVLYGDVILELSADPEGGGVVVREL